MSISEIKKRVFNKYSIKKNNIEGGFFLFFGLENNPYKNAINKINKMSAKDALFEDCVTISNDIKKVFTHESEKLDAEKSER